jgi:hypothetical protein
MASGRNQVDYTDIRREAITYWADGVTIVFDQTSPLGAPASMIGKAVTYSANDTIALAADGDHVIGKLEQVFADGACVVVDEGFVTLPGGNGATLTRGKKIVGALNASAAKGYIREVATATAAELGKQNGIIVNNADATAVVVKLG